MGQWPGHLEIVSAAARCTFVAVYRYRLLGHTGTGLTVCGRLLTVQVVEWGTDEPPLCLGLLEWYRTFIVLPQLLLLGLRGGAAPAELAAGPLP